MAVAALLSGGACRRDTGQRARTLLASHLRGGGWCILWAGLEGFLAEPGEGPLRATCTEAADSYEDLQQAAQRWAARASWEAEALEASLGDLPGCLG